MLLHNVQMALGGTEKPQDPAAVDRAARKLESAFATLLIHSMRSSGLGEDAMFPGAASQYRDVYDQQLAQIITEGRGLGLQDAIRRQLSVTANGAAAPAASATPSPTTLEALPLRLSPAQASAGTTPALAPHQLHAGRSAAVARIADNACADCTPEEFVTAIWPHAQKAAAELGVPAKTLVAQAALETGWGRRTVRQPGGSEAHNLFGIKASGRWTGASATASTTEFASGTAHTETARFRSYGSPAESFADYVKLLKNNPRYADSLGTGNDGRRFAQALQRAGYATDPDYAAKLNAIAEGPTLRRALERVAVAADTSSKRA